MPEAMVDRTLSPDGSGPGAGARSPGPPSPWVRRFAGLIRPGGAVLDVACGAGRHTRLFLSRGHSVTGVDIDLARVADLAGAANAELIAADLEAGPWPLGDRRFAAMVVTNYLWRPLFPRLCAALEPNGVLIYETFARGNARFGKPANPNHLLEPGELIERVRGMLHIVAYEHGIVAKPRPAVVERLCAIMPTDEPDRATPLPDALDPT